jgi:glycerol-3-phosphate cytidylyltransferase
MKYGFVCSTFDLCHAGHMKMLEDAKSRCDYLIVGLQDDPSTGSDLEYRLKTGGKPKNTPVMNLAERYEIMKGIKYVDEIFTYSDEQDLLKNIKRLKDEGRYGLRVLGSDWKGKKYTGWEMTEEAHFHERNHNYSTSELRMRVYHAERERLESLSHEKPIELQSFGKRFAFQLRSLFGASKKTADAIKAKTEALTNPQEQAGAKIA